MSRTGNSPLRVVFMGTPAFSVAALDAIANSAHKIVAVYSQPPRPKGRGHQVQKSPVHMRAEALDIPVYTPKTFKQNDAALDVLRSHQADIAVVVAYGLILPVAVLDAPRYGCLNIHASLLPRWRGAAPIQYAIWKGDEKTGVSIMRMEKGLDTGPVISMEETAITRDKSASALHDELSVMGARMIVDVLDRTAEAAEPLPSVAQDDAASCYAPMLKKDDSRVHWAQEASEIDCQVRALNPWPGVWTTTASGKRFKIIETQPAAKSDDGNIGQLIDKGGAVQCGNGTTLQLVTVQPENAKRMDVKSAINGGYINVGQCFS